MTSRALIVASQVGGLGGCDDDADLTVDVLKSRGFLVTALRDGAASRAGILRGLEELIAETRADDAAVFYFSGYGRRAAADLPGAPAELPFLLPTDIAQTTPDDFRGILADELSVLLWRLTLRSPNVTSILDCRSPSPAVRWPVAAVGRRWMATAQAFERLLATHPGSPWHDDNPDVVRVTAGGAREPVTEGWSPEFRRNHGHLTAALMPILRDNPHVTWAEAIARARPPVVARNPLQHPEVTGPADRVVFTTTPGRRTGRPHPIRVDRATGETWIDDAHENGIHPGDELLLSPTGRVPGPAAPILRVGHLRGTAALLTAPAGITVDGVAYPWRSTARDIPVRVSSLDDTALAALAAIPGTRLVTGGDEAAIVTVSPGYLLHDATGLSLVREPLPDAGRLREQVAGLVTSARLRALGDQPGDLDHPVRLRVDGSAGPITDGATVHSGDLIQVAVRPGPGTPLSFIWGPRAGSRSWTVACSCAGRSPSPRSPPGTRRSWPSSPKPRWTCGSSSGPVPWT
ncbi:caspase family protein [Actinoplanes couchii]|uniref:Peptidase C14 caspase domain-containing protein n=1 Tax=Actinoplanes couchii TaxID=403638 RepID=A0ABQ3X8I6_9ACTN|nr:caspase family protein [Actinoplanes couchii]MDR6320165.1 hypothetical protein [Actinoplanes couchii]GID54821.1 hypothetical protein Aco03nite_032250 [Actinoplanes couchii]